jgi:hypothetical protein
VSSYTTATAPRVGGCSPTGVELSGENHAGRPSSPRQIISLALGDQPDPIRTAPGKRLRAEIFTTLARPWKRCFQGASKVNQIVGVGPAPPLILEARRGNICTPLTSPPSRKPLDPPSTRKGLRLGSGSSLAGSTFLQVPGWQRMTMDSGGDSDQHIPRRVVPLELIGRRAVWRQVQ